MNARRPLLGTLTGYITDVVAFVKAHRRLQVALAGYAVVAVFILSYFVVNQVQNWSKMQGLAQLVPFVFALLMAVPLTLSFVWDRLTHLKLFDVEITFSEVTTHLSIMLPNEIQQMMELGLTGMPDILAKIKTAIGQEKTSELVEVNLREENFLWSTRLYLLAALAEDYTNIRQLVFLRHTAGRERCFIGMATPTATRRALAIRHPELEKAYRAAYRYSLDDPSGQIKTIAPEDEAEKVVQGLMMGSDAATILQTAGGEKTLKQLVEEPLLRQWLGRDLINQSVECKDGECDDKNLKPLLLYRIIECSSPFVALLQDQQLKGMVDRQKIAVLVADTSLRQQLQ